MVLITLMCISVYLYASVSEPALPVNQQPLQPVGGRQTHTSQHVGKLTVYELLMITQEETIYTQDESCILT